MKKIFKIISIILIYFIIITYITNYKSINSFFLIAKKNYYSKKNILNNKEKLEILKKKTKQQEKEKTVSKNLKNFLLSRYRFNYNDYKVNYIQIEKIKSNNIYYIKVGINYKVKKVTTLLTIISMFYKEKFIEKIEVQNKRKINLYLNKNKLILSDIYKKYKKDKNE